MTTQTVKKVMSQRLTRGTTVIVADSFGRANLRGKKRVVSSKSTVKCNGKGRCAGAGDWCVGLAVFVADPKSIKKDKKMGWRADTVKVCLTHLKDDGGVLILPPPLLQQEPVQFAAPSRISNEVAQLVPENGAKHDGEVTWADLAVAHSSGNIDQLALLARQLKSQSEGLKSQVIASQARLIEQLTGK